MSTTESDGEGVENMRGLLPSWVGPSERPAVLEVSKGGKVMTSLSLDTAPIVSLGRSAEKVTLVLDHPSISRLHALVVHHPRLHSYFLIDCGSQHGTFVDGRRVEPKVPIRISDGIEPSEQITFGGSSRSYVLKCEPPLSGGHPHNMSLIGGSLPSLSGDRTFGEGSGSGFTGLLLPDAGVPMGMGRLVLEKGELGQFSDDYTTGETASTTTAETASTLSVDDAQSVGSAELDTLSVMSSASAGSLADLDFVTFPSSSSAHSFSFEARTRSSARGKKRKRVSWNDDVTEIPPLWECDTSGRFAHSSHTTTHSLSREPSMRRPSKHHHSGSRKRRAEREDSARRSAHTFFGARYVPTQPPTLESIGQRFSDKAGGRRTPNPGGEAHASSPSPLPELPPPTTRGAGSDSSGRSPLPSPLPREERSPPRAHQQVPTHQHVPTPVAGSPLMEEDLDPPTPGGAEAELSSREPSLCRSEAESEGQASEAGESSEALTDITETDEKGPGHTDFAVGQDKDEDDVPPTKMRRSSRGHPRMRLPSPPPPTPAELEAQWGSLPCDSGSDGESLVDDRRQTKVRTTAESANRRMAEERETERLEQLRSRGGGPSHGGHVGPQDHVGGSRGHVGPQDHVGGSSRPEVRHREGVGGSSRGDGGGHGGKGEGHRGGHGTHRGAGVSRSSSKSPQKEMKERRGGKSSRETSNSPEGGRDRRGGKSSKESSRSPEGGRAGTPPKTAGTKRERRDS